MDSKRGTNFLHLIVRKFQKHAIQCDWGFKHRQMFPSQDRGRDLKGTREFDREVFWSLLWSASFFDRRRCAVANLHHRTGLGIGAWCWTNASPERDSNYMSKSCTANFSLNHHSNSEMWVDETWDNASQWHLMEGVNCARSCAETMLPLHLNSFLCILICYVLPIARPDWWMDRGEGRNGSRNQIFNWCGITSYRQPIDKTSGSRSLPRILT
jgi:hypothetical protein